MSVLNQVIKFLIYVSLVASVIMWAPNWTGLLDISPRAFRQSLPKSLEGYTNIKDIKVKEFTTYNDVIGPESIAVFGDKVVTGSSDGYIYHLNNNDNTSKRLVRIIKSPPKQCLSPEDVELSQRYNQSHCGRPLGLKFDSRGVLYVVEPSHGIFKIEKLFESQPEVNLVFDIYQTAALGQTSQFLDDLAIEERKDGNHIFIMSDVSTKFPLQKYVYIAFSSELGRIIKYDSKTKEVSVLVDNIEFPNGLELTADSTQLMFTQTFHRTIYRYHLSGEKKGQLEKVFPMLPGEPDNIRASADGRTFWVTLLKPRTFLTSNDLDYYLKKPLLRKIMLRACHLVGTFLNLGARIMQSEMLAQYAHDFLTLYSFSADVWQTAGLILEIECAEECTMKSSIYSNGLDLVAMSEAREVASGKANERILYIGSFNYPGARKLVYEL